MTGPHLTYATFALVLQLAASLALGFLDPVHGNVWAAMGLHLGVTASAVATARMTFSNWGQWAIGVAAAYAVANGALTGFMRTLCIIDCAPGTPFPSMMTWIAIDGAISAAIVLATRAWGAKRP